MADMIAEIAACRQIRAACQVLLASKEATDGSRLSGKRKLVRTEFKDLPKSQFKIMNKEVLNDVYKNIEFGTDGRQSKTGFE